MPVALYNQHGSPPCGLVRMVAKHLNIELELRNLDLLKGENFTAQFRKLNPYQRAPTLDDDGFILYESSAICYYLCNKYAPSSSIYPASPRSRALVDQILATITSTIQPHYFAFFKPRLYKLKKPTPEEISAFEENVLASFQNHIGKDGGYAVGDTLTLADLSLVAHLTMCYELQAVRSEKFPKLEAYYDRIKTQLPYFEDVNREAMIKRNELLKGLK